VTKRVIIKHFYLKNVKFDNLDIGPVGVERPEADRNVPKFSKHL
jgi:hypothetical protein